MERYNDRVRKCTLPFFFLACDQSKNFLGKGNDNAARHSEHAVGPLGRIMALEGQAHLQDAEAQQDKANGADEREKINSLRLLTTVNGSSAANAGTAVTIITMAVQARMA